MASGRGVRWWWATRSSRVTLAVAIGVAPVHAQQSVVAPPPLRLESFRYDVLLVTRRTAAALSDDGRLAKLIGGCRAVMRMTPADSAAAVRHRAFDWSSPSPLMLSFVVLPSEALLVDCGDRAEQERTAAARGLRITYDSTYSAGQDVGRVILRRGKNQILPAESQRAEIGRLTPRGVVATGASAVRVTIPIDSLAPDASGARDDLVLEVWDASDTIPNVISLPWPLLEEAWQQVLEWRGERAATVSTLAPADIFVTPLPGDGTLREARRRYLAADLTGANRLVVGRMLASDYGSNDLGRDDLLNARVQLGLSFAGVGDSAAARIVMGRVLADDPCFTLASDAPAYARQLVDRLHRVPERCRSTPLLLTALRATLLPGFGRPSGMLGKIVGAAALGAIGASLATAISEGSAARSTYDLYRKMDIRVSSRAADSARTLYLNAESQRVAGQRAMTIGVTVWAATVVEAILHEALLSRSLARVQGYGRGARRGVTIETRGVPGQVGLAVSFF